MCFRLRGHKPETILFLKCFLAELQKFSKTPHGFPSQWTKIVWNLALDLKVHSATFRRRTQAALWGAKQPHWCPCSTARLGGKFPQLPVTDTGFRVSSRNLSLYCLQGYASHAKTAFFLPVRCFLWTLQPGNVAIHVSVSVQVR